MADPTHLKILRQGVIVWNQWRKDNPHIYPDLSEADLIGADLRNAQFGSMPNDATGSRDSIMDDFNDLYDVKDLGRSELIGLIQISMRHIVTTNFYHADLTSANLNRANLNHVDLTWAHLTRANLRDATLNGARLWFAEFHETEVAGADFTGTTIGWTKFSDTNLAAAKGLKNARHVGPSSLGIDTIYRSRGKIPAQFLRGVGIPDNFIKYMRSLVGTAFEFHSCFISYSSRDQKFAERLHADLQANGVRSWFAPENLKIGEKLRPAFDEAIRYTRS